MPITILAFVLIFSLVVFVHELGHFLLAKWSGARVEEFGFGYPPRLLRIGKRGDTEFTLNAIPIGGFVRVTGDDNPTDPGSLAQRSPWARGAFLIAGPAMNVVLAVVLFAASFVIGVQMPVDGPGVGVYQVAADSPAASAGLQVGDTILQIDGEPVDSVEELQVLIDARLGQPVTLQVRRDGRALAEPLVLVPRPDPPEGQGAMGVAIDAPLGKVSYPVWEALWLGLQQAGWTVWMIISGLVAMVRGLMPADLTGPIGIAQMTAQVAKSGVAQLLEWTAFLSVNLFILNLLPLPALDGGRLIFVVLEVLRGGRRVDPQKEGLVHLAGIVVLLGLFLVISYFDVMRVIRGVPLPGQ